MKTNYLHILILSAAILVTAGISIIFYYEFRTVRTVEGQEMQTSGSSGEEEATDTVQYTEYSGMIGDSHYTCSGVCSGSVGVVSFPDELILHRIKPEWVVTSGGNGSAGGGGGYGCGLPDCVMVEGVAYKVIK